MHALGCLLWLALTARGSQLGPRPCTRHSKWCCTVLGWPPAASALEPGRRPLGAACCSAGSGPTWRALSQEHARLGAARPAWARPLRYSCRNNQRGTKEGKRKSSIETTRFTLNPKTPEGTGGKSLHSHRIPVQNSKIHGEFLTLERRKGEKQESQGEGEKGDGGERKRTREPKQAVVPHFS